MAWDQETFCRSVYLIAGRLKNQQSFNDRIGVRDALSRWKRGDRPSLEVVLRVADEFQVSLDWLITGKEADSGATERAYTGRDGRVHQDVQMILDSDDSEIINAFMFGLQGVTSHMGRKSEIEVVLDTLVQGQQRQERILLDLLSDFGEAAPDSEGVLPRKKRVG